MIDSHPPQASTEKSINAILGDLIAQRQLLRNSPLDRRLLAANGASIAYWQERLRRSGAGSRSPRH